MEDKKTRVMKRPYTENYLAPHDIVRYWRAQAVWDVVHNKFEEVTREEFRRAKEIMDRITMYAWENHTFVESENENNFNDPDRAETEERLYQTYLKLNEELKRYDASLTGELCPVVVDKDRRTIARLYCGCHVK